MAEPAAGAADGARPLRQPAQGARLRRRAQPARAAGRHPPHGRAARACRCRRSASRSRTGDTPADARRAARPEPARHPRHHARVALPAAHQPGARDPARRRARDRRRGPRDRRHEARLAPRAQRSSASATWPIADPQRIGLSATQRPLEAIGAFLGGAGREVEIVDAGARKELDLEVIVPVEDMARMGEAMDVDEAPGGPAAGAGGPPLDLAVDPPAAARAHPGASVDARSSSTRAGWPSGWRRG